MRPFARVTGRVMVAVFCVWHMAAMAVYAIPDPADDPAARWMKDTLQPWARPYAYALSQWQQWNLFSPEPSRGETAYAVMMETADRRQFTLADLSPQNLPWWKSVNETTMLRKTEDLPDAGAFFERYLTSYCPLLEGQEDIRLVLLGRSRVVPGSENGSGSGDVLPTDWAPFTRADISCRGLPRVLPPFPR